ncbi:substrate-binding periplasmic protein [Kiloniella sp.]|uniref:substrate-binding periplasmic protein n=1 Tax=Kiloniella sp. TaxID=1938587 RepID=UPI003B01414B
MVGLITRNPMIYQWQKILISYTVFFGAAFGAAAQEKGELYIVTEDYPPYEMLEPQNGLRGFDYEVVTEVFKRMGYASKIEFLPWNRALMNARKGQTVGILTCAYLKEREDFILFSDPISSFTNGYFVRSDFTGPVPHSIEDVVGYKVASIKGYESLQVLKNAGLRPLEVSDTKSAIRTLLAGRFDYLNVAEETTAFVIKNMGLSGKFIFHPLATKSFHFCFSKRYPNVENIREDFNKALAHIRSTGLYDKIHAKYR